MMHGRAEIAGQAVKSVAATGASITTLAWWNTNSSAITAFCAFGTFIVVIITAIINWHYKYNYQPTEAKMAEKEKPVKEEKPVSPIEPASVPCGDEKNPC